VFPIWSAPGLCVEGYWNIRNQLLVSRPSCLKNSCRASSSRYNTSEVTGRSTKELSKELQLLDYKWT
jgi:hypothetical protein